MTQKRITKDDIKIDRKRDLLLSEFGKAVLKDRYLLPGEDYQDKYRAESKVVFNKFIKIQKHTNDLSNIDIKIKVSNESWRVRR